MHLTVLATSGYTIQVHMMEKQGQVFEMKYSVNLRQIQKGMPILYVQRRAIRGFLKWRNCQFGLRMQQMPKWVDIQRLLQFYV